jgi:hypothetical protein
MSLFLLVSAGCRHLHLGIMRLVHEINLGAKLISSFFSMHNSIVPSWHLEKYGAKYSFKFLRSLLCNYVLLRDRDGIMEACT